MELSLVILQLILDGISSKLPTSQLNGFPNSFNKKHAILQYVAALANSTLYLYIYNRMGRGMSINLKTTPILPIYFRVNATGGWGKVPKTWKNWNRILFHKFQLATLKFDAQFLFLHETLCWHFDSSASKCSWSQYIRFVASQNFDHGMYPFYTF